MAQKANAISLRLQYTNRYFDNSWYSKKFYDKLVAKDIYFEKYTNTFLKLLRLPLGRLSIQHLPKKTRMFCFFCYPKISRTLRSKMFGVYLPYFWREYRSRSVKKNVKISQHQYDSIKKPSTQIHTKYLYNRNFLAYPFLYPVGAKKTWSSLIRSNLDFFSFRKNNGLFGKQQKWSKTHFFLENCFRYTKSFGSCSETLKKSSQLFSKIKTGSFSKSNSDNFIVNKGEKQSKIAQKDLKVSFNETFLKFVLSLIFQSKVRKHYSFKSTWSKKKYNLNTSSGTSSRKIEVLEKEIKINNIQPEVALKYLLVLTIFQKHVSNTPGLLSGASLTFKNQSKLGFLKNKLVDSHSTPSFSFLTSSKSIPDSNILKLATQKKTFLEQFESQSNLEKDFYLIYNSLPLKTSRILNISNRWKFENIENKSKYKNYIQRSLSGLYNLDLEFIPFRVKHDWQSAGFFADEIVYFLERRVPFRRLKNKLLKYISKNSNIRGVRITCSGRAGGKSKKAQRAKTECVKLGQTSLHVFSNKIDFASRTAQTSFGSVGIKVWISYN